MPPLDATPVNDWITAPARPNAPTAVAMGEAAPTPSPAAAVAGASPEVNDWITAPAAPTQSQIGADISAVGQGAVSGTGAVIAGVGRQPQRAALAGTTQQLAVMDAIDAGKDVPQDQDVIGYQFMSPDQRAKARTDFTAANVEAAKREPNALTRAGTSLEGAAPGLFPIDPALEGHGTAVGRMVGGMAPALVASAAGGAVGGPVGAVLAGAAVVGSQTYDGTYQEAIAKGQTPEQADDAAGKSAALQMAAMSLPISKIIPFIPVPLREGFLKTVANVGTNFVQRGGEMGAGNTLATMAQNYVASQTYDPGRPVFNGTGDAAIDGILAGLVVHGATTAAGAARAGVSAVARPSVADIGAATDIDGAIAAAGAAAQAPTATETAAAAEAAVPKWSDVFPPSGQGDLFARPADEGAGVAPGATAGAQPVGAEITNPAQIPGLTPAQRATALQAIADQQAAGAGGAGQLPGGLPEPTPAQKATALQKMINQSAEDRLTPQGRDDNVYVEGVARPESMKDFSDAGEGEMSAALAHKTSYYTDSNYRGQHDALVTANNNIMKGKLDGIIQDANARDAAMNEAKDLMPGPTGLFVGEKPVDAQPIVDTINGILSGPANKRGAVRTMLNGILDNLKDADGNLENLPSMLKGVRDDITDKLYDKSPTVEGNAARTASNQLRTVLKTVDDTIASGLPGTRYQDYLSNLSAALGQVSKLDFLQKYITGSKKLTDLSGNLLFNKVQGLLNDIQAHHADRTGGAKELTMDEINQIEAVRNELAAKDLLQRRAAVPGSPTPQVQNAAGILGAGPLGVAVRGGAEAALHGALAVTTHGIGNAALGGYRYFIKPQIDAARAQQAAAELAAMKAHLLDTTPRPDAAP